MLVDAEFFIFFFNREVTMFGPGRMLSILQHTTQQLILSECALNWIQKVVLVGGAISFNLLGPTEE